MGFRYGFWRTKLVKKHRKRASLREFLPWFGLLITVGLYFIDQEFWYLPGMLYLIVLGLEGFRGLQYRKEMQQWLLASPISIILLHASFSIGLLYGIFGKTRSFNDRETNNGNLN